MTEEQRPRRAADPDDAWNATTPSHAHPNDSSDPDATAVRGPIEFDDAHLYRPQPTQQPHVLAQDAAARSAGPAHADPATLPARTLGTSLLLTLASTLLPGAGLLAAPKRWQKILGATTALASIAAVAFLAFRALTDLRGMAKLATNERFLTVASITLIGAGIAWVALIAGTHVVTRPRGLATGRRLLGAVVVVALAFTAAAPTAVAARYTRDTYLLIDKVLPDAADVTATSRPTLATEANPWENIPRVNILLLGADGDASRADEVAKYSIRTDTIMVASIDTSTGATTLVQIPRNVQYTPFPEGSEMAAQFPRGFRGEPAEDWFVNSIWANVELQYPDLFAGSTYRGAEALKQGAEGITGLKIDYFVMLNIDGVQKLIDAMGGVTVNINEKLAIGGSHEPYREPSGYLQPGPNHHLMGFDAMWYARSRFNTDDYNRMARQSCLVDAIINQANPQTLLTRFEGIAAASADMLVTDIPQEDLSAIIDLAFRVKDADVTRLAFSPGKNGYSYADPDFEAMRKAVDKAINPPAPSTKSASPATSASPSASSASPSPTGLTEGSQDISDACAWQGE